MKKLFYLFQAGLFIAFNFFLLLTVYQLTGSRSSLGIMGYEEPKYNLSEEFDPSLERLNSIEKLTSYCDSLYTEKVSTEEVVDFEENYSAIASSVVRKRFYHGYSQYGLGNNFIAVMASKLSLEGLRAIVIPNDILRYPFAACSQQTIVLMEVLKRKGMITRKIAFQGKKLGHFCFEVYYKGSWHFYDPDMEPDVAVLNMYHRPGIAYLAGHPGILQQAYRQYPREEILDIFLNYSYGKVNKFAAPKAIVFQQVAKFLSYTIWLFFLIAFILVRKKYLRLSHQTNVRNRRVHLPKLQPGTSPAYHLEY